ncbi:hypothetical protein [uncultured Thiohalocapsa sp.]|uniref:hypothetical protein n=1 Tax=uncultured Thiohalocapsa sp. TaxID=768990 RepID=UPI0025CED072|nr:hypothetical protein [uncultured Thiohalocapsa sp.]
MTTGPAHFDDLFPSAAHADDGSRLSMASLYLPTSAQCAKALRALAADARTSSARLIELPREQFRACSQCLNDTDAAPPDAPGTPVAGAKDARPAMPEEAGRFRLCRGTLTYSQALTLARSGSVVGVGVLPESGLITTDCACGLGFAVSYARARWAGADTDKAIAQALAWQLETDTAGQQAGLGALIAAHLHGGSTRPAAVSSAAAGIAQSPAGRSTADAALGAVKSLTSSARSTFAGAPMRANPVVSTLTAVVNLDLYRAALAHSISWPQFTKNLVVKTSGAVTAAGGWVTGAAAGAAVGGPLGALLGGLLGAAGGGTAGSMAAKRVADRIVPDDAQRMLAIVREAAEQAAYEHLLVDTEVEALAERVQEQVTPGWLRRLYRAGWPETSGPWQEALVRAFATRELTRLCQDIVAGRTPIVPPSAARVEAVFRDIQVAAGADPNGTPPSSAAP